MWHAKFIYFAHGSWNMALEVGSYVSHKNYLEDQETFNLEKQMNWIKTY